MLPIWRDALSFERHVMKTEFKPIRCGNRNATPYLRKNFKRFCGDVPKSHLIADIGCGNMRNTDYLKSLGYQNVSSFDKVTDRGIEVDLRTDTILLQDHSVSVILCNYVLCFLNKAERRHIIREMSRIASNGCFVFVELYPAKNGHPYDIYEIINTFKWSVGGWECIHLVNDRFVLKRLDNTDTIG